MYEYTDRMINYLDKQVVRKFSSAKSLLSVDEINILDLIKKLYSDLSDEVRKIYLRIAKAAYNAAIKGNERTVIDNDWVEYILEGYDPVSKYVFVNEEDRKEARLVEALLASETRGAEMDAAMRSLALMYHIYGVRITDEAMLQAYRDEGEEYVMWQAEEDEKTCRVCSRRDGKIYELEYLPPKPHINCRCWYRSLEGGKDGELDNARSGEDNT